MFPQAWQVGLDIQIDCVRAVAAQRRRNGWQLRHWWQQALPQAVLRDGCLEPSEFLIRALRQWRVQLPRHISLRIALPAQRVLQQRMARPDARLREPERSDYISGHGLKQFPLDGQTLALDYRAAPADEAALLLTAARWQELQQWLHCLRQAGLHPQAVDITPCALRVMATAAGVPLAAGLMHRLDREWLWVAPADGAFAFGLVPGDDGAQARLALRALTPAGDDRPVYAGSVPAGGFAPRLLFPGPPRPLPHLAPPLPGAPSAFALAGGLALREEDR